MSIVREGGLFVTLHYYPETKQVATGRTNNRAEAARLIDHCAVNLALLIGGKVEHV